MSRVTLQTVFTSLKLDEITNGGNIDEEEKGWSSGYFKYKRLRGNMRTTYLGDLDTAVHKD